MLKNISDVVKNNNAQEITNVLGKRVCSWCFSEIDETNRCSGQCKESIQAKRMDSLKERIQKEIYPKLSVNYLKYLEFYFNNTGKILKNENSTFGDQNLNSVIYENVLEDSLNLSSESSDLEFDYDNLETYISRIKGELQNSVIVLFKDEFPVLLNNQNILKIKLKLDSSTSEEDTFEEITPFEYETKIFSKAEYQELYNFVAQKFVRYEDFWQEQYQYLLLNSIDIENLKNYKIPLTSLIDEGFIFNTVQVGDLD